MADNAKTTQERVSRKTLDKKLQKARKERTFHSNRFNAEAAKVDANAILPLADAIAKVKETASTKFDSSVELHIHLTAKKGKKGSEDEYMRGMVNLPNGLGKSRKVIVLTEEMIEEIAKSQKVDFDIAIASPSLMPKMGKIAKLLGTKGKMPNPKAGTVTDNPDAAKAEFEAGRVEFRQDAGRNIHQMIGKASWDDQKLLENAQTVLGLFTANRIAGVALTSSMGPSVKVAVATK